MKIVLHILQLTFAYVEKKALCTDIWYANASVTEVRAALTSLCQTSIDRRYLVGTGNVLVDQFQPWYFGVAFPFCFKYCTGMPDVPEWCNQDDKRRLSDDPRVELPMWIRIMSRRVEAQLRRDWMLGFTMWSVFFQSSINATRNLFSFEGSPRPDGYHGFSSADLEKGALEICAAMTASYKDSSGRRQQVKGDLSNIHMVKQLSPAAKRILQNVKELGVKFRARTRYVPSCGTRHMPLELCTEFPCSLQCHQMKDTTW